MKFFFDRRQRIYWLYLIIYFISNMKFFFDRRQIYWLYLIIYFISNMKFFFDWCWLYCLFLIIYFISNMKFFFERCQIYWLYLTIYFISNVKLFFDRRQIYWLYLIINFISNMEFRWSQDAQIPFERLGVLAPSRAECLRIPTVRAEEVFVFDTHPTYGFVPVDFRSRARCTWQVPQTPILTEFVEPIINHLHAFWPFMVARVYLKNDNI